MKVAVYINPENAIAFIVEDGVIVKSTVAAAVGKPESHIMDYSSVMRFQLPHQVGNTTSADGWGKLVWVEANEVDTTGWHFDTRVTF